MLVLTAAAAVEPTGSPLLAVPAALTLGVLAVVGGGWPRTRRIVAPATGAVSVVSLTGTMAWITGPTAAGGGPWPLLHTVALMFLVAFVCRWSRGWFAVVVAGSTVLAEAVLGIPITALPHGSGEGAMRSWWDPVAVCMFWSLAALVGAGAGVYLRWLDARRAHDVSAMVIQAQAAAVLLRSDPDAVEQVLSRIEADGTRALASMDRTIRMLRDLDHGTTTSHTTLPGAADLPELVERYAGSGEGPIELHVEPELVMALHREAGTTVYRVVVEALTNVRRHASVGAVVTVSLARSARGVVLTVTDQAQPDHRVQAEPLGQRRSGVGLAGLAERVEALGGTFTAGPLPPAGWRVRATLPRDLLEPAR
ncbi:hypothetical protein GCM10023317_33860 [Actinopolymorpha pittospori]